MHPLALICLIKKIKHKMNKQELAKILFATAFMSLTTVNAQSVLSGHIKSDKGEAVPFAVIGIKNTQLSTISNEDGLYTFKNLKNGDYILTTHGVGFLNRTDTIHLGGDMNFDPVIVSSSKHLDEVVVNATRVDKGNGMAYSNVDEETIKKQNLGQDAPYMLNQLPNVVVNSDAGNGVGYTGIRIRGTDATRINVTINGVPVNDAEGQGTYYVDMPDLVSSVNNIQVQRGVGASSNGAGAFGATINFQTNELKDKPYANLISTAGSYDTYRNTLAAGTGLLNDKFTLDARASSITSKGYIDRASSDLQSYYLAAGYYGKKSVLKFINFSGQEKTYQSWYYVPEDSIKVGNRTYNPSGEYVNLNNDVKYYKNQTDNYKQNNFQLHFIHQVNSKLNFNLTGHYTKGKGYYENYNQNVALSGYNISDVITSKGDTISTTDLIDRWWLDNDFAGGIFNFNYTPSSKLMFTLGGGYNTYYGRHFNRVIWARYASDSEMDHEFGHNTANKNDGNVYLKTNFKPNSRFNVFIDLQVRKVNYNFLGFTDSLVEKMQNQTYTFFNPKFGLSYDLNSNMNVYASLSVGNKEPNRDDFVQSSPGSRPKSEQLMDAEAGLKYTQKNMTFGANFYNMQYKNQLVLNGKLNNVGAHNRVNVSSSYRRGVELEYNVGLSKFFSVGANLALSQNKILKFIEYIDSSDAAGTISTQYKKEYKNTDISFSPSTVSSLIVGFKPIKGLEISFISKYVGRQYLDNTSNVNRSINPYNVNDVRINYTIKTKVIPEINFMLGIFNVLSEKYATNGATYNSYVDGTLYTSNYLAAAATRNFMGGINIKF
jgi:iron complex outermembrane receptor protein